MRKIIILFALVLLLLPSAFLSSSAADGPDSRFYRSRTTTPDEVTSIDEIVISGPPRPPIAYMRTTSKFPESNIAAGINILSDVPAFDWSFGCSATSAAMIAGYYDRTGYANMYTGPTEGGLMPLDNSYWPDWQDSSGAWRSQCPLSATHDGLDERTIKGHVDDYWIEYNDIGPDPFIGNWDEHGYGDCTADYMKTNQSIYGNVDGGTTFFNYTDGSPLYWYDMEGYGIHTEDGGYGFKLFYEFRGYTVSNMYNQYILGYDPDDTGLLPPVTQGFTYAQYCAEIDAGRPVMIHVEGHTMVGIGYDDTSNLMYIHDTWDYSLHSMTWGGEYSGMQHFGVTIVQLANVSPAPAAPSDLDATAGDGFVNLAWNANSELDLEGYTVYRSDRMGGPYSALTTSLLINSFYTDNSVTNGLSYYYVVTASNYDGNESGYSNEASATPQAPDVVNVAISDYITNYGTVVGTYQATQSQDNEYQSITEQHSGGKPSKRSDLMEHIWTFNVTGGNHIFNVDAYYDDAGDEDSGFKFSWSTSPNGTWINLLTVTKTSDNNIYQTADLGGVSGTIYVRVIDNNSDQGQNSNDTLKIDHMYTDGGVPSTEPPMPAINPDPVDGAINVQVEPTLSWTAGAGAESHDVNFGTDPDDLTFMDNQGGTTYTPGVLDFSKTYYWRIDEVNNNGTTLGTVWSFTTRNFATPSTMHVDSIILDTVKAAKGRVKGRVTVIVVDDLGDFVQGATVEGTFTGGFSEPSSGDTNEAGVAVMTTGEATKKPVFDFCVDNIDFEGLTYDDDVVCSTYP